MADTLKKHSETEPEKTWDLTRIYNTPEDWEQDFKNLATLHKNLMAFKRRLSESPETLKAALEADDAFDLICERLFVYAHLKSDEDTSDSTARSRLSRIEAKSAAYSGETAWFLPELLSMEEQRFQEFLKSDALAFYRRSLEEVMRDRPHTLSEKEERILSMASDALSTPEKAFSLLNDADLHFPEITDDKGNKVELTHGNYIKFLESPDRRVRKEAFESTYNTYETFQNTFSALLEGQVKNAILEAELRNFPSALEASLFGDNVPTALYNGLIDSVHRHIQSIYRYFALRAKVLKLPKLNMYDIHTPLIPECRIEVSWEDAVSNVSGALKVLGEEYHSEIFHAFKERWIDIPECRAKRSGAYSSGCYGKPPYMLLNFNGSLDSMFTLAHELGHSMHSYFSDRNQKFHYASYRIFVAEVASTVNELLLLDHLLRNAKEKKVRAYLLNHLLDEFRGTVFRQTMFAEFERDIHAFAEKEEPLTAEKLSDHYFELNKFYHGDAVNPDRKIRYEWARIPHFYYNFYVYKYATGFSAAAALSRMILQGNTAPYMTFLKAGCSKDVLDIMKDAGVDFLNGDPVGEGLKLFDETLNELETLLNENN